MLRSVPRALGTGALILAIALLLLEGVLQVASLFARERASAARPDARYTVLCVGDSHTYGALVAPEATYPSQLEALLEEQAPGRYAVLNVGVPGMSTGQLRERLPGLVLRYEPDFILVWAGVNNSWNRAGQRAEHSDLRARLEQFAARARVYRLARTWLHDRQLDRERAVHQHRTWEIVETKNPRTGKDVVTVRREDGGIEVIQHDGDVTASAGTEWQERTEQDYAAITRHARTAGIPIAFIGYPMGDVGVGGVANRALRNVTEALDVPLVESTVSVARIPEQERHFLWAAHPDGRMYGEVARDILPLVLRYLPPRD